MFTDIVFPKNNEREFLTRAEKLDIPSIAFIYPYTRTVKDQIKKTNALQSNVKIHAGILATHTTVHKARNSADTIIVKSSPNDRAVIEKGKPDILFNVEGSPRNDFMHHRNSGLNQVLCKLAKENNIAIGVSVGELIQATPLHQAQRMGRISQNITFCRKYKVKMILASFTDTPSLLRSPHDILSLGIVLGMHPIEVKNAMNWRTK